MAIAVVPSMPPTPELVEDWLCDADAASYSVSWDKADWHTSFHAPVEPTNFHTVGGAYRADEPLSMTATFPGDEESLAYTKGNTSPAFPDERRIVHRGLNLILIKGKKPCFLLLREGVVAASDRRKRPFCGKHRLLQQ